MMFCASYPWQQNGKWRVRFWARKGPYYHGFRIYDKKPSLKQIKADLLIFKGATNEK